MGEKSRVERVEDFENGNKNEIIDLFEMLLIDSKNNINLSNALSVPIDKLSTIGVGFSSFIPVFETIRQTKFASDDPLFRIANLAAGDMPKIAKNGNF